MEEILKRDDLDATISVNSSILFVYISLFFRPILSGGNS